MSEIGLHRGLAGLGVGLSVGLGVQGNTTNGRQDKSADRGRAHVVGCAGVFGHLGLRSAGSCGYFSHNFKASSAIRAYVSAEVP